MAHGPGMSPPHRSERRWWWWLSIVAATLSYFLGYVAFCLTREGPVRFLEAFYGSAHLLLLHMPDQDLPDADGQVAALFLLYAARFLAVVAVAATGVAVIAQVLGRQIQLWRMVRKGGHAVICGLGGVGRQLAAEACAAHKKVVAIDEGENALTFTDGLEGGVSLIPGSPAEPRFLRRAGIASASYLFAASDDDTANIGAGLRAIDMARQVLPKKPSHPLRVCVHVADPQLRIELHGRNLFEVSEPNSQLRVNVFSVFENSARLLLADCPLDYASIRPGDPRSVQIVIIGFGHMGEAILMRAAMSGHYANLNRLRAVIVDLHARRAERLFRARYPQFDQVADAEFLQLDAEEPETQARIAAMCDHPEWTLSTVVVAFDNPSRALSVAFALAQRLHSSVPIRVRLGADSALTELIQRQHSGAAPSSPITAFGSLAAACRTDVWTDDDLDTMAKAFHEDYVRKLDATKRVWPGNPNAAPWDLLPEDLRESNRQAADHVSVKLRALGYRSVSKGSKDDPGVHITAFTEDAVDLLAKMEHRRWMAERFLAGWVLGSPKDIAKRISPWLIEWEQLPPDIQDYDRNAVRVIPGILDLAKRQIRH
jgi:voltage-gated potassium channel Kch